MNQPVIAAFDFDGTLTRRDTLPAFIRFSKGLPLLYGGLLLLSPMLVAYKLGLVSNARAKQRLFSFFFKDMTLKEFDTTCEAFCREQAARLLRPSAVTCIGQHLALGDRVVIVSASLENWVKPFARTLHVGHVLGTQPETSPDGRLTGRFLTRNCHGQEKVKRLLVLFPERESYRLLAYGDSRGDKELLAFADESHYKLFRD